MGFDAEQIREHLCEGLKRLDIETFETIGSTNAKMLQRAARGDAEGTVIVAGSQSEGRGRLGRSFYSPAEAGLYMSILLRPKCAAKETLRITATAAAAVCRALGTFELEPKIKWVNDILIDGKKVCGILAQSSLTADGINEYVVLGIGINLYEPKGGYPEELQGIAAGIFSEKRPDAENRLAAEVINSFFALYRELDVHETIREYREQSCVIGERITVINSKSRRRAIALGIGDDFGLIVEYEDKTRENLSYGEISIRVE